MVVSGITVEMMAEYLKLNFDSLTPAELEELTAILDSAKSYAENYTGLTGGLDDFEEMTIAVFVLCQGMYDDRSLLVDKNKLNSLAKSILDMHSINYL